MIKVYGYSDDNVAIINEGTFEEDEIGCFEKDVRIRFDDGTVIRVGYPKRDNRAIWWIEIERHGTSQYTLGSCTYEEDMPYSDVFEIDANVKSYSVIRQKYKFK